MLDNFLVMVYNTNRKGKTSNGYATRAFKIALTWQGGGYLTFFVSVNKNTITKIIILIMYFLITTTSFSDFSKSVQGGITAQF